MKIKTKLQIIAILPITVFLLIATLSFVASRQLNRIDEQLMAADEIEKGLSELTILTHEYSFYHGERSRVQWEMKHGSIEKSFVRAFEKFKKPEENKSLRSLLMSHKGLKPLFAQVVEMRRKQNRGANTALSGEFELRLTARLFQGLSVIRLEVNNFQTKSHEREISGIKREGLLIISFFVVLAMFIPAVSLLVIRAIGRQNARLRDGIAFIASGNLDYQIGLASRDEMGQLSNAFDKMTGELKKTYTFLEQEISVRKLAEEKQGELNKELRQRLILLAAANKELEDFSYTVSHDLKAPLRAIDGFSNILFEDYSHLLDDEGKRLLNIIGDNERRMAQLIEDILSFLHFRNMEPKMSRINMEELVKEVCKELESSAAGRSVRFEVKALPKAYGDMGQIRQVFYNLLSNAVKFTRTKDVAMIEVGTADDVRDMRHEIRFTRYDVRDTRDELIYYVKDNGVGFDMQYANKLFGVFLRLHHAEEFEGNAIGLAIVKRIIEKHGGRVWAEGKVGEGATFYLSLPKLPADG